MEEIDRAKQRSHWQKFASFKEVKSIVGRGGNGRPKMGRPLGGMKATRGGIGIAKGSRDSHLGDRTPGPQRLGGETTEKNSSERESGKGSGQGRRCGGGHSYNEIVKGLRRCKSLGRRNGPS